MIKVIISLFLLSASVVLADCPRLEGSYLQCEYTKYTLRGSDEFSEV